MKEANKIKQRGRWAHGKRGREAGEIGKVCRVTELLAVKSVRGMKASGLVTLVGGSVTLLGLPGDGDRLSI